MNLGIVSQADIDRLTQMLKHEKFSRIHDRIRVALWGLNGLTAKTIADRLDRKIRWAQTWAARFRDEGVNGLFGHPKPGFTQKLPHDCEEIFVARVLAGPLKDDEVSIFHGKEIQQILRNEFHCNYSLAGVYLLLHRLRLSWIVPRPVHEKNDPEAMKVWLEENSRILAEEKKKHPGKQLDWWFCDESRYGEQGNLYHIWAATNTRPQKIKQMGFDSCYLIGAVNPSNGDKVGLIFSTLDTDVMNLFFKELENAIPANHHVILVLDGAGFHRGKRLEIPENITLRFLPPYSPELNPIERLWKWMKEHYLGNTVSKGIKELFERGTSAWEKVVAQLIKTLCFVDWIAT